MKLSNNDLLTKEWDYEKNEGLLPDDFSYSSNKKVYWLCDKGHSYLARISSRTRTDGKGTGCPYCSGTKVLQGFNDLKTVHPLLAKEWDYEKNLGLKPEDFTSGSNYKAWWKCSACGCEFSATISHRTRLRNDGSYSGCPNCKNKRTAKRMADRNLIPGETDLLTKYPDIAAQWDYEKNNDKPENYSSFSGARKWWICDKGHSYDMPIANRTGLNQSCPFCSGNRVLKGFNDFETLRPEIAKEWHPTKNGNLTPDSVASFSTKKVWWICPKGHEYQAAISNRSSGNNCPICANKQVLKGFNDLETLYPNVLKEWDYNKNIKKPSEYLPHTDKKVYWLCDMGHSYEMRICDKTKDNPYGCPICSGKQLLVGFNDLKTLFPEVSSEWNYDKNDSKPEDHIAGSHKKAYWKCTRCNNEWIAQIKERTYGGTGCPKCAHYYKTSIPEQAIYYYVSQLYSNAVNSYEPDFLNGMEIDVYIPEIGIGIEYDGKFWHGNNERDGRKSELLKDNGIKLIRIKETDNINLYNDYAVIKSNYRDDIRDLTSAINELLDILEPSLNHSVDIVCDTNKIYSMSTERKLQKSLLASGNDVLTEWNYELNESLTPDLVTPGSRKIVWWHCSKCGKDWQQSIKTKVKGGLLCPTCSHSNENQRRTLNKIKSGQVKSIADIPELLKEWNDSRDPSTVSRGSEYKASWRCSVCGNHFKQVVKNRTLQGQGCPQCGIKKSAITRSLKKSLGT